MGRGPPWAALLLSPHTGHGGRSGPKRQCVCGQASWKGSWGHGRITGRGGGAGGWDRGQTAVGPLPAHSGPCRGQPPWPPCAFPASSWLPSFLPLALSAGPAQCHLWQWSGGGRQRGDSPEGPRVSRAPGSEVLHEVCSSLLSLQTLTEGKAGSSLRGVLWEGGREAPRMDGGPWGEDAPREGRLLTALGTAGGSLAKDLSWVGPPVPSGRDSEPGSRKVDLSRVGRAFSVQSWGWRRVGLCRAPVWSRRTPALQPLCPEPLSKGLRTPR